MHLHLLRKIRRFLKTALKRFVSDLLRLTLLSNRPRRMAQAGFVLPTTVLLVLMVVLTATALTYRTFTRSEQAIVQREQQVIANAATPAIDRAKAKIEFLFRNDPRFPSGLPASDILYDMMSTRLQAGVDFAGYTSRVPLLGGGDTETSRGIAGGVDPYTLADETRLDINNDGRLDNAWSFVSEGQTIIYSILVDDAVAIEEATTPAGQRQLPRAYVDSTLTLDTPANQAKADALITRTAPLATTEASPRCAGAVSEGGWQIVTQGDASNLQKNFQVNAFVANGDGGPGQTFETLEFQQSRQASRASKWGAWFRYDLEIFPGANFNWNGAMHTDGSLFVNGSFTALHMVSSHNSCVYSQEASELSLGSDPATNFVGQAVKGGIRDDNYDGSNPLIHVYDGAGRQPRTGLRLTNSNHSVTNGKPSDVALNPMALFTQDRTEHMNPSTWSRRATWDTPSNLFGVQSGGARILNNPTARPFVDDFYRADNRWGPKPRYDSRTPNYDVAAVAGRTIGDPISGLGGLTDPDLGLDGYWERQAIKSGLRVIVGQRLELGNNDAWNKDPLVTATPPAQNPPNPDITGNLGKNALYPSLGRPSGVNNRFGGNHEYLQRRSLQDNLAAVQGMVVYHYQGADPLTAANNSGQFPAACVAATAHPGSRQSIVNSRTFARYSTGALRTDFLNGQGTNGWEFQLPEAFNTNGKFGTQLAANAPLGIALRNLANFAGDPGGGAPSFKAYQDAQIHPYPYHSMWGDFSPLRRVLLEFDNPSAPTTGPAASTRYNNLSFADRATLHSAACTLSMLAYNMKGVVDEWESKLKDPVQFPPGLTSQQIRSIQNVTNQVGQGVADLIQYMAGTLNGSAVNKARNVLNNLPSGSRDRTTWVDPNPSTVVVNPANPSQTLCPAGTDTTGFQAACDAAEFFADITIEDWRTIVIAYSPSFKDEDWQLLMQVRSGTYDVILEKEEAYKTGDPLFRDRELGFREGLPVNPPTPPDDPTNALQPGSGNPGNFVTWDPDSGNSQPINPQGSIGPYVFETGCNPNIFSPLGAQGTGGQDEVVMAGLIACSPYQRELDPPTSEDFPEVKYPSLFYLFPVENHGIAGDNDDNRQPSVLANGSRATLPDGTTVIPGDPEFVTNISQYIANNYSSYGATAPSFRVLDSADPWKSFEKIAALPKLDTNLAQWSLPVKAITSTDLTAATINNLNRAFQIDYIDSTGVKRFLRVPFLDKGLYDGREQMNVRVLDMDVELLTTERVKVATEPDYWLPSNRDKQAEGVVFAFREDAVREDEIVRPVGSGASNCTAILPGLTAELRIERTAACQMRVTSGLAGQDPPLTAQGISIKPVDFIADPQRRPHGFRLRTFSGNPADFSGGPASGSGTSGPYRRDSGMTFVTDNSLYVLGDFNLHTENGATSGILEEFIAGQTLWNNSVAFGDPFYNSRTTLNTDKFAVAGIDHWRPVELLSDAITVLSKSFRDGAVEDGLTTNQPTTLAGATSSYLNQNRPVTAIPSANLRRSQIDTSVATNTAPTVTSPPYVDRNGTYYDNTTAFHAITAYNADTAWINFNSSNGRNGNNPSRLSNLQKAEDTFVNATFVSGIVPKRIRQSYGGLHNYPRLIEEWGDRNLYISGSFIQLNFSTGSTGPYEQDAWEAGTTPTGDERIGYYLAPVRRWGYDVGLLYLPPAPAARRFVTIGAPRSEYYREIASDDWYIINLRCAKDGDGNLILNGLCPVEDKVNPPA